MTDLAALGWAGLPDGEAPRGWFPGRISRVDRRWCTLLTADGELRIRLTGEPVCSGDWVLASIGAYGPRLERVLPRRTALVRADPGQDTVGQIVAANADTVAVVESVEPTPNAGRLERLLALAWASGAKALVVLAKSDLASEPVLLAAHLEASVPGLAVHPVSAVTGDGIGVLAEECAWGRTLALVGASGAGKSSLVNALVGRPVMNTAEIRGGRGRHTTTFRALVPVPGGGAVIDTPGLRAVGMAESSGAGVDAAFADIVVLASLCRHGDCRHDERAEGCAVVAALERGELARRRFDAWRRLRHDVAVQTDPRAARRAVAEVFRQRRVRRQHRGKY
ncbi:ribosome small subunit-dependent GTPase A [Micromonospora sp. DT229]|uniref:ribosome small subunit-dependent GTPase A n=1 Tax=Micromonospora sp. DT229 TaxID=3393430 RepID=UPI003CF2C0E2